MKPLPRAAWLAAALLALPLAAAVQRPALAQTTVLFAGGEDTDFTFLGGSTFNTETMNNGYRSSFARELILVIGNTSAADPPVYRVQTPIFTSAANLWVHAQAFLGGSSASAANIQGILLRSPDGVSRIVVRQTATLGQLKVSTRNAAGTITDLGTATTNIAVSTSTALDLYVNYTCSGAGGVQLYVGGTLAVNYSGNPCTDAATQLNQAEFASLTSGSGSNSCLVSYSSTCWSEIIIASGDTRGTALWTLTPKAAGNTQAWTGAAANIDKATISDATYNYTGSTSQLSEWTTSDIAAPAGQWNVLAVAQSARALVGTSGPQHFEWAVRTGGSDYTTGSVAPSTSFGNFPNQLWAANPATSANWQFSDLTAAGFNLGIESTP